MRVLISLLMLVALVSCAYGALECGQTVKGNFKGPTPDIISFHPDCKSACRSVSYCTGFGIDRKYGECRLLKGNIFDVDDDQNWTSERFCREPTECGQKVQGKFTSHTPVIFSYRPNCRAECKERSFCTGFSFGGKSKNVFGKTGECRLLEGNKFDVDGDQSWTSERVCR